MVGYFVIFNFKIWWVGALGVWAVIRTKRSNSICDLQYIFSEEVCQKRKLELTIFMILNYLPITQSST